MIPGFIEITNEHAMRDTIAVLDIMRVNEPSAYGPCGITLRDGSRLIAQEGYERVRSLIRAATKDRP